MKKAFVLTAVAALISSTIPLTQPASAHRLTAATKLPDDPDGYYRKGHKDGSDYVLAHSQDRDAIFYQMDYADSQIDYYGNSGNQKQAAYWSGYYNSLYNFYYAEAES